MSAQIETLLRLNPIYRRLSDEDRRRLAEVSRLRSFGRGETIFSEGEPSDFLYTVVDGRVKVVKMLAAGKEVILEIFGPGDPVGAVAALESRPYPASAVALAPTSCLAVQRAPFFALLESSPTLARSLLVGLTFRLVELTRRISEVAGSRVEVRMAHLFLKLAGRMGEARGEGVFIPLALSRQDLADLAGTTIETCIRLMSRWGKEGIVVTEKDGFLLAGRAALEELVGEG